jgi:hypothetical protein
LPISLRQACGWLFARPRVSWKFSHPNADFQFCFFMDRFA